jgi:uncharacterized protein YutE (UPF0331/DUF86 family)
MVLKPETVRERLKRLDEVAIRLDGYRGQPRQAFLADVERQWLVERRFIVAAECVVDIAGHILSGSFAIQPSDHEDAVRRLAEQKVISAPLAARLRGIGGFRNILVHDYLRIDPARVHDVLETKLEAFRQFGAEIAAWLEGRK